MIQPNFLIIGAQKAGSTWIYDVLRKHEKVFLPSVKELHFFTRKTCEDPKAFTAYLKYFKAATDGHKWIGEKTPGYFWSSRAKRFAQQPPPWHNPHIARSVRRVLGSDLKLIVSLRHPVARAISAYGHHALRKRIRPYQHLKDVAPWFGIGDIGFYDKHLASWEEAFGAGKITTLIFENDIVSNPEQGLQTLCETMEIERSGFDGLELSPSNQGRKRTRHEGIIDMGIAGINPVRPEDVQYLLELYAPTISALRERFGDRLDAWDEKTASYEEFVAQGSTCTGKRAKLSPESTVGAYSDVSTAFVDHATIGRYCTIGHNVRIGEEAPVTDSLSTGAMPRHLRKECTADASDQSDGDGRTSDDQKPSFASKVDPPPTRIGNDVWIGSGAIIMAGVTVGDGAIILPGTIVSLDVAPFAIVKGPAGAESGKRFDDHRIERLLSLKWWDFAQSQMEHIDFTNVDQALDAIEEMRRANVCADV